MKIDRDDLRDPSDHRVAAGKTPAITGAISYRNDPFRIGGRIIGPLQRAAHIFCHWPSDHQDVGVARRRDEPDPEALDVVVRIVQRIISSSQALHDPASISRIERLLPRCCRAARSTAAANSSTAVSSGDGARSVSGLRNKL